MRQLAEGLWCIDHEFRMLKAELGLRTTIVRLSGGGLLVHSPGPLQASDIADIQALGPVVGIFAPNAVHHLFLRDALAALGGELWVTPGLPKRVPAFAEFPVVQHVIPRAWGSGVAIEKVDGANRLQETVLYHAKSKTLILTDLVFNEPKRGDRWTRTFLWANDALGKFKSPRSVRATFRNKRLLKASFDRILAWDFDRITLCHGDVVESGGHAKLTEWREAL